MENINGQDIKNKKKFLKRYRKNLNCITRLEEKLNILTDRLESAKSPNYSGMPRGSNPVDIADLISDKTDLENRISRLKNKGKVFKAEIFEAIDSLDDSRYCEVLEGFCIDCKSIDDIAEDMGYSSRWTYDLYSEAIIELIRSEKVQ
jgi:hypothetical protein